MDQSSSYDKIESDDLILQSMKKLPRFLSFNTFTNDVTIDLDFRVPFVKIPTKKLTSRSFNVDGSSIDINIPSLVISGLIVVTGIVIGQLLNGPSHYEFGKRSRSLFDDKLSNFFDPLKFIYNNSNGERSETRLNEIIEKMEEFFRVNNIDMNTCFHKSICTYIKNNSINVVTGKGTSLNKIVDGIISSNWVLKFINGTAIKDAIDVAKTNTINCNDKYFQCKWSEKQITNVIKSYF